MNVDTEPMACAHVASAPNPSHRLSRHHRFAHRRDGEWWARTRGRGNYRIGPGRRR